MANVNGAPLVLAALLSLAPKAHAETKLILGDFSQNRLDGWEHKRFSDATHYQLQTVDGKAALKADSSKSASGLFKTQTVNLTKTPFLNWSWRIENRLTGLDERSKGGDDYAARIYVVIKGGLAFWQTKAINYVWAGSSPTGSIWPNPFAGKQAMMVALQDAATPLRTWQHEKRNVQKDLQQLFGEALPTLDAVALMTDTDNSQGHVSAYYGDIWFSAE